MSISYAAGHEQMSSLLYQYNMFILYPVSTGDILMCMCKVQYTIQRRMFMIDYLYVLFMRDSMKY
jgi:hypothetical protein